MIELPNARQQILVGVNQSILASLSMVIIAAVIGGFDDIGREVLVATNKGSARFGEALSAGLIIVLMAVVIDRLSRAASMTQTQKRTPSQLRQGLMLAGFGVIIGFLAPMDNLIGTTSDLFRVTESAVNDQLNQFITSYGVILDSIKNNAFIYVLLPLRIGLEQAVMPMTWGVEFSDTGKLIYQMIVIGGFGLLMMRRRWLWPFLFW
jgi:glycine betaine/proline transport system permease protein